MKKSGAGLLIIFTMFMSSLKAQPLNLGRIPIATNKKTEIGPLKKHDFVSPEEDLKEDARSDRKKNKEYRKLHQKEIRKTQKAGRKNKQPIFAIKPKEEIGL
jgi:hypothetical protein